MKLIHSVSESPLFRLPEEDLVAFYRDGDFKPPEHRYNGRKPKIAVIFDDCLGSAVYSKPRKVRSLLSSRYQLQPSGARSRRLETAGDGWRRLETAGDGRGCSRRGGMLRDVTAGERSPGSESIAGAEQTPDSNLFGGSREVIAAHAARRAAAAATPS